jgi:hypothetical protein
MHNIDTTSPPRSDEGRMMVSALSKNSIERPYIPFPYALCPKSNICFAVALLSACSFATCKHTPDDTQSLSTTYVRMRE